MSSTDNVGKDNIEELPVSELNNIELRREKIRIQKEIAKINSTSNRQISKEEYTTIGTGVQPKVTDGSFFNYDSSKKRDLERRLKQVENQLRTTLPTTSVQTDGNLEDSSLPNYGTDYTLEANGYVKRTIPGGTVETPATTSGYLIGTALKGIPAGSFRDAKDIGTPTETIQEDQAFKDAIYANYINKPQDVIELKKKLFKIAPGIMSGEPIDGEVTPTFLEAMSAVQANISERNYYRKQSNQSILTTAQGLEYFLERGSLQKPKTKTEKSFYSISDGEARAMLENFYSEALGRRPTKDEVNKFASVVRKRAERQPQVGQITSSPDGLSEQSKITQPGFGEAEAALAARRQAEAGPEFESYRLATSYYTALLRAIGSPAPINRPGGE
jgi:hypothetical protein